MTGLTKDGQAVASSKYQLYGATQSSTDETGNPYAYNGEARDSTGLDYLRARYYDSQAGTFLTEDSYSGSRSNPLSQNRYSYVHNNPVNYTDPSGHFRKMLPDGKGPRYTQPKPLINPKDGTLYAPTTPEHEAHQIRQQQTGVYSYTYVPSYVPTSSAYEYIQQQESQLRAQAHAQAVQYRQQQIQQEYAQSIGQYGRPRAREANNLLLNWSKALKDMFTHVCDPKTTKAKDKGRSPKPISFGGGGVASWESTAGPSSRYQPNVPVPSKSKKGGKKKLSDKELVETIQQANQGNSAALSALLGQHSYAPVYEASLEEGAKAAAVLSAGIVGLITKNPVYVMATYGGLQAGLTSAARKETPAQIAGKTVIGGISGYTLGKIGQGLGAKSLFGRALVDGSGETALDTIVSGLNGESISMEALSRNFAGNVAANALFGLAGKVISKVTGSKVGDVVDEFSDVSRVYTKKDLRNIIGDIAETYDTSYKATKYDTGYSLTLENGKEKLTLRIMDSGSGGRMKPYYRISTSKKGTLTEFGVPSSDRGLTHIDVDENSVDNIKKIIDDFLSGGNK
ncbi:hypothetical protein BVE84_10125 [Streptococcus azizii]|uniref:Pre-toxin TG domain-containing protein n=1 Tax=Streptococcus azizii TaxID=1579424 RepID=A0AB36JJL1_9STRE|nr:RHS repeat-associated core domain-containing protein [Streptococcus azizii]ONK25391.1 hypothetical protein BVE86_10400 [Streptococcus azizii]ONK25411.1 hypothetical protein BVE85_10140 [Streptococcus azizii]ONK25540.1 hypothetical protein BVE84_10125 [Streptococcus azizii]